jgi:hypothetical protein
MKRIALESLEVISVISWFLMDSFWMNDLVGTSKVFAVISGFTMLGYMFVLSMTTSSSIWNDFKMIAPHITSFFWLMMNLFWMLSESDYNLVIIRNIFMGLGGIGLVVTLIINKKSMSLRKVKIK